MRPLSNAIEFVLLLSLAAGALAQERTEPTPSPSQPPVPKLRVPRLPGTATPSPVASPAPGVVTLGSGDSQKPSPRLSTPPSPTAVPARTVRLPGAGPPTAAGPGLPRLSLDAIAMINGKPVAVISGRRVAPGDTIAGARVLDVLQDRVELEYQGRRFAIAF